MPLRRVLFRCTAAACALLVPIAATRASAAPVAAPDAVPSDAMPGRIHVELATYLQSGTGWTRDVAQPAVARPMRIACPRPDGCTITVDAWAAASSGEAGELYVQPCVLLDGNAMQPKCPYSQVDVEFDGFLSATSRANARIAAGEHWVQLQVVTDGSLGAWQAEYRVLAP
jgi:hypothetical protein